MFKIKVSLKQQANNNNINITVGKSALTHLQNVASRTTFTAQLGKVLILE